MEFQSPLCAATIVDAIGFLSGLNYDPSKVGGPRDKCNR